ncbi:[Fe-Fe] hydrogenase large subunit C-terminal domain-containing protein [Porcipelethomonas sp.]|uniref:[Fe-Fe] hydrogenase large subunit C-terminal domain-containing protein n=1 Tax=Porcipelethomonas sp. TaxID=2981675 RepID=UPI003EF4D3BF
MENYLQLKKLNCKNCYKCIRHCPVKSIKFSDNRAYIIADECILCGTCFVVCPQNAKQIRNDVNKVKDAIASGKKVMASIAPSFAANYNGVNITQMRNALKKLGFSDAEETAVGAQMVTHEYEKITFERKQSVIISSCCNSVNTLIQKHYPAALKYLADVLSPMQAHCQKLKKENPDCYTVFVGPCISKKEEAEKYPGIVDAVLTFEELTEWMEQENVTFEAADDPDGKYTSRLYPTNGGILRTIKNRNDEYSYISVDGTENCINALKDIIDGKIQNCFIEMSACSGSCIGGPVMSREHKLPVTDFVAVDRYAGDREYDIPECGSEELKKDFKSDILRKAMPSGRIINEILHKMGKSTAEQELNCGSCGYDTCREKAIAVYQNKADFTMCLPFLKDKAESFSDKIINNTPNGIIVLNEELIVQQINNAACEILNIKNQSDILNNPIVMVVNPAEYLNVMDTKRNIHDKKVYLEQYEKYVEETIIYDQEYHIIMSIMRDITQEENEREKRNMICSNTIEITDKVIEKQMRTVQEIASLLGETVAETKVALTNLKESLGDE